MHVSHSLFTIDMERRDINTPKKMECMGESALLPFSVVWTSLQFSLQLLAENEIQHDLKMKRTKNKVLWSKEQLD